jgi:F-type H+-transporting ATPase subunit alpha
MDKPTPTQHNSHTHLSSSKHNSARVIALFNCIAHIEPLASATVGGVVQFENNEIGLIWQVALDRITVLLLAKNSKVRLGGKAKFAGSSLYIKLDDRVLGHTVDPLLQTIDGKTIKPFGTPLPVFGAAPSFHERAIVDEQLETGVLMVDTLFPIVKGQRIAIIGDNKTGKTTFMSQVAAHQKNTDAVIVYVAIAKRRHDVARVQARLKTAGVTAQTVFVVADAFESLPTAFLAPYVGCAIAESFWRAGRDTLVIYDDLSVHAKLYRELSLLLRQPPGREGYPGDMFWQHSSLLERAGKLKRNKASQTVLAAGTNPTGDLTGYLSTSLISMTDGQIVFDVETMTQNIRPAIDVNISVSRVGGRTQSPQFQKLSRAVIARLANYRNARDFSRFGADQSETVKSEIARGEKIYELFTQSPDEQYSTKEQFIMLDALMQAEDPTQVNIAWLKSVIHDVSKQDIKPDDYVRIAAELIKSNPAVS